MNYYLEALQKYALFKGRAGRKEFWYFTLFNLLFTMAFGLVDQLMGNFNYDAGYGPLSAIYTLVIIIPGVSVSIRRLHDSSHSGWWFWITVIPVLGLLVFLYFTLLKGDSKPNEYN